MRNERPMFVCTGMVCSRQKKRGRNKMIFSLPLKTIFGHSWGDLPIIFTRENHWQITSRVTKKIFIRGNSCIILYITTAARVCISRDIQHHRSWRQKHWHCIISRMSYFKHGYWIATGYFLLNTNRCHTSFIIYLKIVHTVNIHDDL